MVKMTGFFHGIMQVELHVETQQNQLLEQPQ